MTFFQIANNDVVQVKKPTIDYQMVGLRFCGPDGARTRDPMRDRHVF